MPVQVWAQKDNLQTSYGTLNIWLVEQIGLLPRYQILGSVSRIVVTDPRGVGIVLSTTRLQEETAIFPDAMESRTLQWRLPDKGRFLVKFHQNLTGELPLLMNEAEIREAPDIYSATRVTPHFGSSAAPVCLH